ncbi:MAG: hypothetical protein Q7R41_03340 [Phycisphaerales bacterium]|nr:hypothetical protein [Phycisphaerales bacterium]
MPASVDGASLAHGYVRPAFQAGEDAQTVMHPRRVAALTSAAAGCIIPVSARRGAD